MQNRKGHQIVYFDGEGRGNLPEVIRVVKQKLKSREELRYLKLIVFTKEGEGALMAYQAFSDYDPKIIAVTFPVRFSAKQKNGTEIRPKIPQRLKKFFDGVEIKVIAPATLPLDTIAGLEGHNQQVKLVRDVIAIFGGGFGGCIQAVLVACDLGEVELGERVIAISGDCAAIITASTTSKFLTKDGISINEIFCKPRTLTIARPVPAPKPLVLEQQPETSNVTTIRGESNVLKAPE